MAKIILVLVCFSSVPLLAQSQGCPGPEYHLFDFWIGDWDVFSGGAKAGENSIKPILDGCVLQETWTGSAGGKGTSLNYYNPSTHKWNQYWVWQNGRPLGVMEGEFKDGQMTLGSAVIGPDGKKIHHRITWTANADGTVRQLWETSANGNDWAVAFDGLYKKKAS